MSMPSSAPPQPQYAGAPQHERDQSEINLMQCRNTFDLEFRHINCRARLSYLTSATRTSSSRSRRVHFHQPRNYSPPTNNLAPCQSALQSINHSITASTSEPSQLCNDPLQFSSTNSFQPVRRSFPQFFAIFRRFIICGIYL